MFSTEGEVEKALLLRKDVMNSDLKEDSERKVMDNSKKSLTLAGNPPINQTGIISA